jgi:hypothetical protein
MNAEVGLRFHLRHPSGQVEVLLVDSPSVLIGSAAHCEVRLADAAHEHIEVVAVNGVAYLETRAGAAPPLVDGVPFVAGPWQGQQLDLGPSSLFVEVVDLAPKRAQRSPFWVLAPVPLLAGLAVFAATRSAPAAEAVVPPAPALLDPAVTTCPAPAGPTLPAFAAEKARIGYAKRERSPFSPADGVEAVGLLETAAACYHVANLSNDEREVTWAARSLRGRLDEEYHVRRVRIEHAFKVGDPFAAKRELSFLVPLIAHRRGPYVDWLGSVDRYANQALDERSTRRL